MQKQREAQLKCPNARYRSPVLQREKEGTFLRMAKASAFMGVARQYLYQLVAAGRLKAYSYKVGRPTLFVKTSDLEAYLKAHPNADGRRMLKQYAAETFSKTSDGSLYSAKEIGLIYHLNRPAQYMRDHDVKPSLKVNGTYYYSKTDVKLLLDVGDPKEWVPVETLTAAYDKGEQYIRDFGRKHSIPYKKNRGMVYYSKTEFHDALVKKIERELSASGYISYKEAMTKAGMNRNQLDYLVRKHHIGKLRNGRCTFISLIQFNLALKATEDNKC